MTLVDLLVVVVVGVAALAGWRRGLVAQLVSFSGVLLGAIVGSRVAPLFLSEGAESPWIPLASLVGALVGAVLLQALMSMLGTSMRARIAPGRFRIADSAGGLATGALVGLGMMWLLAALAIQQPAVGLRSHVEDSFVMARLVDHIPARTVLAALESLDPLPLLSGIPHASLPEPDPSVIDITIARAAYPSVVEIIGTSCGVRAQGSGWVASDSLVVTNAHVVAGQHDTSIYTPNGQKLRGDIVFIDPANDIAVLRVEDFIDSPPLLLAERAARGETVVCSAIRVGGPSRPTMQRRVAPPRSSPLTPSTRVAASARSCPYARTLNRANQAGP